MSLTLNVSKEAKLFYQNDQKVKERLESGLLQPSSTIFMKKYSPNRNKSQITKSNIFDSSGEEQSDEENANQLSKKDWSKKESLNVKRRRLSGPSKKSVQTFMNCPQQPFKTDSSRPVKDSVIKQRCGKGEIVEKQRLGLGTELQLFNKKEKSKGAGIVSRDVNGDENDSDEIDIDGNTFCDNEKEWEEPTQSQDMWHAQSYNDNIVEDNDQHISENNPFAKQRLLKSRYKSLYSS